MTKGDLIALIAFAVFNITALIILTDISNTPPLVLNVICLVMFDCTADRGAGENIHKI